MRSVDGDALKRFLLLAVALAAPALCFGQEAGSAGAGIPSTGVPAAQMPVAGLPGFGLRPQGLGATRFGPMPANFTEYGAAAGMGETDNVNLSSTDPKAQTLATASLFFDLIRSGSRLDLNAIGNFADTDYLEGAYGNKVLGRFDGLADLTLWEHHLKWLVRDDYGDQQINVLQSLTPLNLQRVNVFSTGPDLTLEPTLTTFVEMQGIYSRNSWQDEPFSGNTDAGSLTAGHRFSHASSISLVGRVEEQHFDNRTVNTNYQVREYYARYFLDGARTRVDLQGGVAQANDTGSWTSSPLVRLSVIRHISPYSVVSVAGGREYSNAMRSFASLASGVTGGIPVGAATQTTGNALRTYGSLTWGYQFSRTSLDFLGSWERQSYDVQSKFNFTLTDIGLNLRRQLTPRLSANIIATLDRGQYVNQGFKNTFGTAGAGLIYHPGTWVVIYGRFDHEFRHSSGLAHGFGYDQNRIFVMIGYYPHSSGTGLPREMGGNGFR